MRKLLALIALLGLSAPAHAAQAYFMGPTFSTTTGRGTQSFAGVYNLAASSQTISTPTIRIDGIKGGVNASSAIFTYGITAATATFSTGTFTGTGNGTFGITVSSGINVGAGVYASFFSGLVTTGSIPSNSIDTSKLKSDSVTTVKILALNVDTGKIAPDAITNSKILAGSVDTAKIAASGVAAGTYGSGNSVPVITITSDGRITGASVQANTATAFASTQTVNIPQATNTNTLASACIAGSTVTLTFTGGTTHALITPGLMMDNGTSGNNIGFIVLQDGAIMEGATNAKMFWSCFVAANSQGCWLSGGYKVPTAINAGAHSFCIAPKTAANTWTIYNGATNGNFFRVDEVP